MANPMYPVKRSFSMGRSADVAITTTPGALIATAGAFLAIEGVTSILFSQDQQTISTVGRVARIGIGVSLLGWVISKS